MLIQMIRRIEPLPRCPVFWCRRSGLCHSEPLDEPCWRVFEDLETRRGKIADMLEGIVAEHERINGPGPVRSPEEQEHDLAKTRKLFQDCHDYLVAQGAPPPKLPIYGQCSQPPGNHYLKLQSVTRYSTKS